jgi:hypothetical protein
MKGLCYKRAAIADLLMNFDSPPKQTIIVGKRPVWRQGQPLIGLVVLYAAMGSANPDRLFWFP